MARNSLPQLTLKGINTPGKRPIPKPPFCNYCEVIEFPSRHSVKSLENLPAYIEAMEAHLAEERGFVENWIAAPEISPVEMFAVNIFALIDGLAVMLAFAQKYPEIVEQLQARLVDGTLFNCAVLASRPWLREFDRQAYIKAELQGQEPPTVSDDLREFSVKTGQLEDAILQIFRDEI